MFGFVRLKTSLLKKFGMHYHIRLGRMDILRLFTCNKGKEFKGIFKVLMIFNFILLTLAFNTKRSILGFEKQRARYWYWHVQAISGWQSVAWERIVRETRLQSKSRAKGDIYCGGIEWTCRRSARSSGQ
jgi:hypothetical protein